MSIKTLFSSHHSPCLYLLLFLILLACMRVVGQPELVKVMVMRLKITLTLQLLQQTTYSYFCEVQHSA